MNGAPDPVETIFPDPANDSNPPERDSSDSELPQPQPIVPDDAKDSEIVSIEGIGRKDATQIAFLSDLIGQERAVRIVADRQGSIESKSRSIHIMACDLRKRDSVKLIIEQLDRWNLTNKVSQVIIWIL